MKIYQQLKSTKRLVVSNYNYVNNDKLAFDLEQLCSRKMGWGVATIESESNGVIKATFNSVVNIFSSGINFVCVR